MLFGITLTVAEFFTIPQACRAGGQEVGLPRPPCVGTYGGPFPQKVGLRTLVSGSVDKYLDVGRSHESGDAETQ